MGFVSFVFFFCPFGNLENRGTEGGDRGRMGIPFFIREGGYFISLLEYFMGIWVHLFSSFSLSFPLLPFFAN